ncbi:hypothetical protein H310_00106 [Aphanomyces invadans]|uniref:PX domain-containing protein n=1 Tax=Aphanomyces invadans TaxID=157072 RepID=A0A024UUC3_9STRA|nr:hypothetical protein H310_00106 [Aphanomyces invadans]ETW09555.1 hypothetical protein H310_00106 [Aphanomyces invadans]|eukprot:XP_008860966.1 hypothetical protein H310_00106 [Aphanomyces invadans]
MQLIVDVPFLADGEVNMVWDLKHTIFLAIIVYLCSGFVMTTLVWAVTLLLALVGYWLFVRSGDCVLEDDDAASGSTKDRATLPDDAIVVAGGTGKIVGTTSGHGGNPKRLFYSLSIVPTAGLPWTIERSYKEFRALYHALYVADTHNCRRNVSLLTNQSNNDHGRHLPTPPPFPKRAAFRAFVNQAKRTEGLAAFLQFLVQDDQLATNPLVVEFLGAHSPLKRVQKPEPALPSVPWISPLHTEAEDEALTALTPEERSIVDDVHADAIALHDALLARRIVLLRYISNQAWEVEAAKARVHRAVEWRQASLPSFDRAVLRNELHTGKMYLADFWDSNLNAIVIVRLHLENSFPQANYLVNAMYTMERALLHCSPVHRVTIVIDFSQWQFKHGPEQGIFFKFVKMMEAQYLLHVDRVVLFDLPWYMTQGFNVMKPFFDPVTRSKFVMAKSTDLAPIETVVDTARLLQHVGVGATFPFDVDTYLSSVHVSAKSPPQ